MLGNQEIFMKDDIAHVTHYLKPVRNQEKIRKEDKK